MEDSIYCERQRAGIGTGSGSDRVCVAKKNERLEKVPTVTNFRDDPIATASGSDTGLMSEVI
jgi:hypothetical protein